MKKNFSFIVFIILLLVFEIFIGISLSFFTSKKTITGTITLAELDFNVDCEFEENMQVLPNTKVLCNLVLNNKKENGEFKNLINFYFRFKISAKSNEVFVKTWPLFNSDKWFLDGDYYYYNKIVLPSESVNICDKLLIDKNTGNNVQGKNMEIDVFFEAIQTNAVADIWGVDILEKITNF